MRIRTTVAAVAITAALLLTGCSSSDDATDKPSKPTHSTATTGPMKFNRSEAARRCVDALVDQAADDPSSEVGTTRPKACAPLDDSEYADAILEATSRANRAGQIELQDDIDAGTGGAG
ncbi:hypothetical protein AB0E27_20165 [Streptomyces sparsogenes]|uniref:hypothetical protein n=1 Tax=Streptomyces sparsogenes TaxID=67365 RepID=UPI0033FB07FF